MQKLWVNGKVGTQWADPKNPLGRFVYSSYTQADYSDLFKTYMYIDPTEWWVSRDYGKYNVSSANPKRLDVSPTASEFWFKKVSHALLLISARLQSYQRQLTVKRDLLFRAYSVLHMVAVNLGSVRACPP